VLATMHGTLHFPNPAVRHDEIKRMYKLLEQYQRLRNQGSEQDRMQALKKVEKQWQDILDRINKSNNKTT
jgi:hypothetical protein